MLVSARSSGFNSSSTHESKEIWRYLREAKVAYLRAVAALISRSEFQSLLAINDDFEGAVRQDLVCEGLQALGHALLQFLITQVEV